MLRDRGGVIEASPLQASWIEVRLPFDGMFSYIHDISKPRAEDALLNLTGVKMSSRARPRAENPRGHQQRGPALPAVRRAGAHGMGHVIDRQVRHLAAGGRPLTSPASRRKINFEGSRSTPPRSSSAPDAVRPLMENAASARCRMPGHALGQGPTDAVEQMLVNLLTNAEIHRAADRYR